VDFRYSDLIHTDLSETFLYNANLSYANLEAADLRGTSFYRAVLIGADLSKTDLRHASLRDALASAQTRWPHGFDWRAAGVALR
jgi:uncharacterized protein YjbI with pentapeptide repeats